MKIAVLLALLCYARLVSGEKHTLKYFYTASSGIPNFPDFVAVGMVDEVQFIHYDGKSQQAVSKQDWMKAVIEDNPQYLQGQTEGLYGRQQSFKDNINTAKERFNQTAGVHTFQFMYGCQWDDETEDINAFRQFGYDGEDFISFDAKTMQYTAPVKQAFPTKTKWENLQAELQYLKNYYHTECVEWLQKYVNYGRSTLERKVDPEVSLVQKGPEVVCHATGFYPDSVMITWKKDGAEMDEDVDVGETLPNEDGTFQKRSVLTVSPEERKKAQYSCEVTHKGSIFRPREPRTVLETESSLTGLIPGVVIGVILLVAFVALAGFLLWKKRNSGFGPVNTKDDVSASSDETTPQKV